MSPHARARLLQVATVGFVALSWYATAEVVTDRSAALGQGAQIWIPSGLALGIAAVTGAWAAIGVAIGAAVFWMTRDAPVAVVVLVALIDAGEVAAGAYLLSRVIHVRHGLTRVRDVTGLLATLVVVTASSAAAVALVMMTAGGKTPMAASMNLPAWWWAHFCAAVVLVPLIVVFDTRGAKRIAGGARLELVALVLVLVAVAMSVFDSTIGEWLPFRLHSYHVFPLLIWASLRWDMRVGTLVNAAISGLAVVSWIVGVSPFATLPALHSFVAICAILTLVLSSLRSERILTALRGAAFHEAALDAIITVGPDGRVAEMNPAAETLFGVRANAAVGREVASLLVPPRLRAQVRQAVEFYNREGGEGSVTRKLTYPLVRADGEEFPAEVALTRVRLHGEVWFTGFVRDITAERNAELARRESRELLEHKVQERTLELISANEELKRRDELLRQAQALAKLGSYDFDVVTARFQWSDELVRILGRDPSALTPTYDGVLECIHPDDRKRVRATLETTVRKAQPFGFETRVVRPDSSTVVVLCRGRVVADERGAMVRIAGYCQDITERVRSDEARSRLSHIVESSADAIFSLALDGTIDTWNAAASRIFGYAPEEVIGKPASILVAPGQAEQLDKALEAIHAEPLAHYELRHVRKDGSEFEASVAMSAITDHQGHVLGVSKVLRDITEQKVAEQRLWLSLREKDVLLREIHHRVKNNLQVISSLLNLQLQRLPSAAARQALVESQSRIRSMALVHQMLYRSKDLGHINFLEYLQTVVDSLVSMYGIESSRIDHKVMGDAVDLDIDRAIVCGLIVTELVTNSLRHAFPNGDHGHVTVAARRKDSDLSLEVRDDGIGLPTAAKDGDVHSFGLQIARTLAQQLEGALDVDTEGGTCISIRFPLSPRPESHDFGSSATVAS